MKDTPETHKGVPRNHEVPLGLGREPEEEHGIVGEDWGYNRAEIKFRGENRKEESEDEEKRSKDGPRESQEEETLSSASC